MTVTNQRKYNCKDEELPVICNYVGFSFKRDLAEFTAFSPKMDEAYYSEFMVKTKSAMEIVEPKNETVVMKTITEDLYTASGLLLASVNKLDGYLKLAKNDIPISVADFGITALRKSLNRRDAEGIIKNAHIVNANIAKYKLQLTEVGLSEILFSSFLELTEKINQLNQTHYELFVQRKGLVQSNVALFSNLYDQLVEICTISKILYKATDKLKVQEYTFTYLLKKVRMVYKAKAAEVAKEVPKFIGI